MTDEDFMAFVSVFFFLSCLFFSVSPSYKTKPATASSLLPRFYRLRTNWVFLCLFLSGLNLRRTLSYTAGCT